MATPDQGEEYKQKFRPEDPSLDREVDAALGGLKIEELYAYDKPQPGGGEAGRPNAPQGAGSVEPAVAGQRIQKGTRRGKVISVDKDEVFVDLGGKSQGV